MKEMEGTAIFELWCSVILIIISAALMQFCKVMWLKPRRIRSKLSNQGIGGPKPTSFLHGNIQEMNKILSMAPRTTLPSLGQVVSHDWYLSTFPYLQKWSQEYGSVYLYSIGNKQHLYISLPDLLKELNLHKSLDWRKPIYLTAAIKPMLGNDVIKANGESWAYQRKLIAPEFFLHKVKGMAGLMEESTMAMVEAWRRSITESKEGIADITVDQDLRSVSADIILKACFGSSYAQGKQIFEKLRALQKAMSSLVCFLDFHDSEGNRAIWKLKKEVDSLILKVFKARQERQQDGKSEKDLLQLILEAANNNSQFQRLTMVIQESMRLCGPAIVMIREAFADIKLGDLIMPKGTHMWNLIPVLHRDPEIWGPDAEEFKPERFANGISKACKYPQAYMPFGFGS